MNNQPTLVKIIKDASESFGLVVEVEKVTGTGSLVVRIPDLGYRTYQTDQYEVVA